MNDLNNWNPERVLDLVNTMQSMTGALLPVLHAVQHEFGFIPSGAQSIIAEGLNLSLAEIHGVISFYHYFRSAPGGRHTIQICRAESCQAMGARELERHAKQSLKIDYHQTTADGEISLEPVYCLGNCACSPALRVGEEIYAHVDTDKFDTLVNELTTQPLQLQNSVSEGEQK